MANRPQNHFSLIELLIVIAIIAILAAMLLPSLARARYSARLVTCTSMQRQLAIALTLYASDNDRNWPSRDGNTSGSANDQPYVLASDNGTDFDDRPKLARYINNIYQCPFQPKLDLFNPSSPKAIVSPYNIYAGWLLKSGETANRRIASAFTLGTSQFDIIVTDKDYLQNDTTDMTQTSHSGFGNGILTPWTNPVYTESYFTAPTYLRGPIDLNYTRQDGSSFRITKVQPEDSRLRKVPYKYNNANQDLTKRWQQLPTTGY